MATGLEDLFVVFLRGARNPHDPPELVERPVTACASYDEARRIQRFFQRLDQDCVIRFQGNAGGGD